MSRTYSAAKIKMIQRPKGNFEQYLYNANKPPDDIFDYSQAQIEAELIGDVHSMRRQVRRIAQRLRGRNS